MILLVGKWVIDKAARSSKTVYSRQYPFTAYCRPVVVAL